MCNGSCLGFQIGSAVLGICFLLGIPGNILVVVLILQNFKRDNFTLHLMLNLAVSDILCLLNTPLLIYNFLLDWHIGGALCKTHYFFIYLSVYVSVLSVTLISVHRYVFVLYPHKWAKLGQKGEKALLLFLWTISCIACGAFASTYDVNRHSGSRTLCWRTDKVTDKDRMAILLGEVVMTFIIPFSIIATSYSCLHKKVTQGTFFSNHRITRLITSIVVTFLVLWTPSHVVSVVEIAFISVEYDFPAIKRVRAVVDSFVFVNSCVNPLLYAFNYHSLRQTLPECKRESPSADQTQSRVV